MAFYLYVGISFVIYYIMSKIVNGVFCWDFTLDGEVECEEVKEWLKKLAKKWCFQLEKGEKTGYVHYQGRVSLIVKVRMPELKWGVHWTVTCKENVSNWDYVSKDHNVS